MGCKECNMIHPVGTFYHLLSDHAVLTFYPVKLIHLQSFLPSLPNLWLLLVTKVISLCDLESKKESKKRKRINLNSHAPLIHYTMLVFIITGLTSP